jgi:glycine C-acetyltransferase
MAIPQTPSNRLDDSHTVEFMVEAGRGTHEHHKVMGCVDILTATLGKALGGASGGHISAHEEIADLLRRRS